MKNQEIKFKNLNDNYSIIIGRNLIRQLPKKIGSLCPKAKKIAFIIDKNIPKKFLKLFKKNLKNYDLYFYILNVSEKSKSMTTVNFYLNKLFSKNFNRSDLVISVGGGITGDVAGFIASIFKRGINFVNMPTTLLAQVDSAIGGKTGINNSYGKNLIGSFYQPRLVLSDTDFLESLPKKEIICGYAEILKHSIIKDKFFFHWLKKNTKKIFNKSPKELSYAIRKSCEIKMFFVNKDLRMLLNFGHTFAHAIEAKNSFSKNISHGEAVLAGMILETRLSLIKKICKRNCLQEIVNIYNQNNLSYTFKSISKQKFIVSLIPYLKNDKKNNDDKINFVLLKRIGQASKPNKYKMSENELKKYSPLISRY